MGLAKVAASPSTTLFLCKLLQHIDIAVAVGGRQARACLEAAPRGEESEKNLLASGLNTSSASMPSSTTSTG
eukprot:COSAG06_NODE_5961_length_3182_cov_85.789491_4_plen_72_part_00